MNISRSHSPQSPAATQTGQKRKADDTGAEAAPADQRPRTSGPTAAGPSQRPDLRVDTGAASHAPSHPGGLPDSRLGPPSPGIYTRDNLPPTLRGMVLKGDPGASRYRAQVDAAANGTVLGNNIGKRSAGFVPAPTRDPDSPKEQLRAVADANPNVDADPRYPKPPYSDFERLSNARQSIAGPLADHSTSVVSTTLSDHVTLAISQGKVNPGIGPNGKVIDRVDSHRVTSNLTSADYKNAFWNPAITGERKNVNQVPKELVKIFGVGTHRDRFRGMYPNAPLPPHVSDWMKTIRKNPRFDENGNAPMFRPGPGSPTSPIPDRTSVVAVPTGDQPLNNPALRSPPQSAPAPAPGSPGAASGAGSAGAESDGLEIYSASPRVRNPSPGPAALSPDPWAAPPSPAAVDPSRYSGPGYEAPPVPRPDSPSPSPSPPALFPDHNPHDPIADLPPGFWDRSPSPAD